MKTTVLSHRQIEQKLQRIAYEIIENNNEASSFYLIGIKGNGSILVKRLEALLMQIGHQKVETGEIIINKQNPFNELIRFTHDDIDLSKSTIILVDDVINSGRTMQYALAKILEKPVFKIKTVALVDRKHRRYPIHSDYIGLTLSTTLQDRVKVDLGEEDCAYLV